MALAVPPLMPGLPPVSITAGTIIGLPTARGSNGSGWARRRGGALLRGRGGVGTGGEEPDG